MSETAGQGQPETLAGEGNSPASRRCIVSGAVRPREALIRFVVGPDRLVWPDLQEKLPGRGLWVSCEAAALDIAVRKNLFAKAAKTNVKAAPDLAAHVAEQLRQRLMQLLGLARRSGAVVSGFAQVEPLVQRGQAGLLLIASDSGADGRAKLAPKMASDHVISLLNAAEMGRALGQEQLVYAALEAKAGRALIPLLVTAAQRFSGFAVQEKIADHTGLAQIGAKFEGEREQ